MKKKTAVMSLKATIPSADNDRFKTFGNVEHFNYLGGIITNGARCTREIESRIVMTKAAFNKNKTLHQQIGRAFKE